MQIVAPPPPGRDVAAAVLRWDARRSPLNGCPDADKIGPGCGDRDADARLTKSGPVAATAAASMVRSATLGRPAGASPAVSSRTSGSPAFHRQAADFFEGLHTTCTLTPSVSARDNDDGADQCRQPTRGRGCSP